MMKATTWLTVAFAGICLVGNSCGHNGMTDAGPRADTLWVTPTEADPLYTAHEGLVYTTVNEALLYAERLQKAYEYTEDNPLTICIAPSVYWIDDPDDPEIRRPDAPGREPYGMDLRLSHLRLVGLSADPADVVFACSRGQTQGADGNFTMFCFTGDDIQAENITFGNYCNVDLIYPRNPSLNRPRREKAIVQAQLIICHGDKVVARNCRFISRLNLCPFAGAKRALFEDCYFECTNDALCGSGIYLHCGFTFYASVPFYSTESTGSVFIDCDIHSLCRGTQCLTKQGSPVAMIDCRWTSDDPNLQIGWSAHPTDDLRCYEYGLTLNGKPLHIDVANPHLTVDLNGKDALRAYKLADGTYNIANLMGGNDQWNPTHQAIDTDTYLPTCLALSSAFADLETAVDTLHLSACPLTPFTSADFSRQLPDGETIVWSVAKADEPFVRLLPEGGSCTVIPTNTAEEPRTVHVLARTGQGLQAACVIDVRPHQMPAPAFVQAPTLRREGNVLTVDYQLATDGHRDCSLITWYRSLAPDHKQWVAVAVSRDGKPLRSYQLTSADNGSMIAAGIAPQHAVSQRGEELHCQTESPLSGLPQPTVLSTDFSQLPTVRQPLIAPGLWTVMTYKPQDTAEYDWTPDSLLSWDYAPGIDGAEGIIGLQNIARGARLLYTPTASAYGDMELTLRVAPCKSAGQGFGSATGQYMDVCLKFDTQTLTGYALRIQRTPKNDSAVDFSLVAYNQGKVSQLTTPVSATCYRTDCTIRVSAIGNRLNASVETTAPRSTRSDLPNEVRLMADIEPNTFGGLAIQHTGSTGQSATLLRRLDVVWH